ncbi:TetR/AcrR family transcriptional regulator [Terrimonas sp. NA20]|uniref:TetR/AcrR family transcriptional regulator n=1 Tax=Terrimonas ginsenosidimutans TaxID=2908004 RepID=A0ABS9L0A7_9BACT|nr:TetR/AcrR family transcriptional regulator [Terrimonas ginsenosidimutans]MCG2618018.1 TetR/AcrR family transcriptional regulator [Terrimonas ginsenosidimutans]
MGIADRKAREKEDLRNLILKSAKKLFVEKGVEQTTIRSIAESIDYSVGTVYLYFKDKNAILYALHSQGFSQLSGDFKVLYNVSDPLERLKALCKVYIQFAGDNPDMYDLMFNLKAPMEFLDAINEGEWNEGKGAFDVLHTTVKQCISEGHFTGHKSEPLAFMVWSLVHGMCSLEISKRCIGVNIKNPETIVSEGFAEFAKLITRL